MKLHLESLDDLWWAGRGGCEPSDVRRAHVELRVDPDVRTILLPQDLVQALGLADRGSVAAGLAQRRQAGPLGSGWPIARRPWIAWWASAARPSSSGACSRSISGWWSPAAPSLSGRGPRRRRERGRRARTATRAALVRAPIVAAAARIISGSFRVLRAGASSWRRRMCLSAGAGAAAHGVERDVNQRGDAQGPESRRSFEPAAGRHRAHKRFSASAIAQRSIPARLSAAASWRNV